MIYIYISNLLQDPIVSPRPYPSFSGVWFSNYKKKEVQKKSKASKNNDIFISDFQAMEKPVKARSYPTFSGVWQPKLAKREVWIQI